MKEPVAYIPYPRPKNGIRTARIKVPLTFQEGRPAVFVEVEAEDDPDWGPLVIAEQAEIIETLRAYVRAAMRLAANRDQETTDA